MYEYLLKDRDTPLRIISPQPTVNNIQPADICICGKIIIEFWAQLENKSRYECTYEQAEQQTPQIAIRLGLSSHRKVE